VAAKFVLLVIGAYLIGSLPVAFWVAKFTRGIDLRQYGSGSVGATNLLRSSSWWIATPVGAFDLGKGMLMVWVAQLVGLNVAAQVTVGLAAILGHNWSVFLRFSGGRGILTTLGVALILPAINSLVPWGIAAFLVIAAISSFGFHNVPLGVGAGIAALPVVSYGVSEPLPITLGCLAMFAIMVIKRLAVRRAAIAASLSRRELLINRLLFDRDIRDREAWIYHTRHKARSAEEQRDQKKGQPQ